MTISAKAVRVRMFRELDNTAAAIAVCGFCCRIRLHDRGCRAGDDWHHPEWRNVYNLVEITLTTHGE